MLQVESWKVSCRNPSYKGKGELLRRWENVSLVQQDVLLKWGVKNLTSEGQWSLFCWIWWMAHYIALDITTNVPGLYAKENWQVLLVVHIRMTQKWRRHVLMKIIMMMFKYLVKVAIRQAVTTMMTLTNQVIMRMLKVSPMKVKKYIISGIHNYFLLGIPRRARNYLVRNTNWQWIRPDITSRVHKKSTRYQKKCYMIYKSWLASSLRRCLNLSGILQLVWLKPGYTHHLNSTVGK